MSALLFAGACDSTSGGPRALILADASGSGSGSGRAAWVDARAAEYQRLRGRAVRVLRVDSADAAIELASRGEADVALLPASASGERLDRFFASDHGREVGAALVEGERLKVLSVNPKQHPKVDPQNETLAQFLVSEARP